MTTTATQPAEQEPETHHGQPYRRLIVAADLVTDQAVTDADSDEFHHSAIAKAVGDLTLSTAAPVNIALFGPWGSGKSTFYNLMERRVHQQDQHVQVVRYDAWKYGGQTLKRNFLQDIARQLDLKHGDFDRDLTLNQEQARIRLGRWARYNWTSIVGAGTVGLIAAAVWTGVHSFVDQKWVHPERTFWHTVPDHITEFGLVLAAVLTTLLLGPKALESAVVKTTRPAIERDDQFAQMFRKLIDRIKKQKGAHRVVFFIDELDRCEPDDVVATLVDLKTFLDEPDCVFVVAADRDVLEHALGKVPQAKPIRDDDPYYSTPGAFIDKIFQHQIALPPLRSHALSSFAHQLVSDRHHGLWYDLQDADPTGRLFNDVVYILVPAHISSPRRVKVLLNNFATSARIAQSRHIDWISRARELAFLTVLETEFPTVAATLIHFPDLLSYIRNDKDPADPTLPPERKAQIDRLNPATDTDSSVAGKIVRDDNDPTNDVREKLAQRELARQLDDYLGKLAVVADLHDPRPDLFYLRVIGYDEGLTDPALGEMIDLAAERQPDAVLAAFKDESPEIKALAARLLIQDVAHQRGIGQANVLESACRLVEQLPHPLVADAAHLAPEVLSHVGNSAWRPNTIPGALFLAAAQNHAADQVSALVALLDPSHSGDDKLLQACIPALAWADGDVAKSLHAKIAEFLPATSDPLATALSNLPGTQANRAYGAFESAIEQQYDNAPPSTALALFDTVTDAILRNDKPGDMLWSSLFLALNRSITVITARIHERRDDLLSVLDEQHRACLALWQIELGERANWEDWMPYLTSDPALEADKYISTFARDAAKVIAQLIPTSNDDLTVVSGPVMNLLHADHKPTVFTVIAEQIPAITWGDPTDLDGQRWSNLHDMVQRTAGSPEDDEKIVNSISASLLASVTTTVPAMIGAPGDSLVNDWHARIGELPASQCKSLDAELAKLTSTALGPAVVLLRLRIAARNRCDAGPLPVKAILAVAGEPMASVMAGEWLRARPRVEHVVEVHRTIPMGTGPLSRYASSLAANRRTTMWIAFEADHASKEHLRAVGSAGVLGEAIDHMAPKILNPAQRKERDAATDRLLLATFAEEPTKTEQDRGETIGHKAASRLALALLDTGVNDNVILAARIIIHSGGFAHGTKTKLRSAFTKFGNGKQSRNFTKTQASRLRTMELLAPTKKGRWAWLTD
ncbi:P-loop NTPase fold protein [Nocardioides sp. cx-173]|uniref:KAP family P-loop NTPase fold protein n=1 Tax=Nocardioides sp. cx-173 TaxID=2898796 RepID=UPI001E4C3B50|nr:P-loop NTPase fold protein [Nocardioides sp. cx-173]MCD4527112.1 KAP family NTPase [Nocardioides sp. cx-173]UGB42475.1 KAP family NTPase [Nocardioides sp. cx-173]